MTDPTEATSYTDSDSASPRWAFVLLKQIQTHVIDLKPSMTIVKPPHEMAGVVRLLIGASEAGVVGADVHGSSSTLLRIWRKLAGRQVVDELGQYSVSEGYSDHLIEQAAAAMVDGLASPGDSPVEAPRRELHGDDPATEQLDTSPSTKTSWQSATPRGRRRLLGRFRAGHHHHPATVDQIGPAASHAAVGPGRYSELPKELGDPPTDDLHAAKAILEHSAPLYASAGLPNQHFPTDRPLDAELAFERHHAATQRRIRQWAPRGRDALEAINARQQVLLTDARQTVARLDNYLTSRREALEKYDEILTRPYAEPRNRSTHTERLQTSGRRGIAASFSVIPFMRIVAIVGLFGVVGSVVALEQLGANVDIVGLGVRSSVLLLISIPAGLGLLFLAIGRYQAGPPEVAARQRVANDLGKLEDEHAQALDRWEKLQAEVDYIDGLLNNWDSWVSELKEHTKYLYEAELLIFRRDLAVELWRAGRDEPAWILGRLPLPALSVPTDDSDDLIGDTGVSLPSG